MYTNTCIQVYCVLYSYNSSDELLVSGYIDGRVLINEVATGNHLATLTDHRGAAITDLSISKEKISVGIIMVNNRGLLIPFLTRFPGYPFTRFIC